MDETQQSTTTMQIQFSFYILEPMQIKPSHDDALKTKIKGIVI